MLVQLDLHQSKPSHIKRLNFGLELCMSYHQATSDITTRFQSLQASSTLNGNQFSIQSIHFMSAYSVLATNPILIIFIPIITRAPFPAPYESFMIHRLKAPPRRSNLIQIERKAKFHYVSPTPEQSQPEIFRKSV